MTEQGKTITANVDKWLVDHNVKVSIQLIGDSCPMFCEDIGKQGIGTFPRRNHIHGQHYRLHLARTGKPEAIDVDYWGSYKDAELSAIGCEHFRYGHFSAGHNAICRKCGGPKKPAPSAIDVLSCCDFSAPDTFEDFCSEF